MKYNKRYLIATIILTVLAVSFDSYIIMHSCFNGDKSTESSQVVVHLLQSIINTFKKDAINESNIGTFSSIVRKLVGHFGAFVVAGLLNSISCYLWINKQKWYKHFYGIGISLSFGLFLAILTEVIQLFIPQRSGQFTDILIDFSGYILGTSLVILFLFLFIKHHQKDKEKEENAV